MVLKEQMLQTIQELPDDVSFDDAMERLYLMYKIERGIEQSDRGEVVSQEEARQRMARWLQ
jgi:predicted transcriptional regulator